MRQRERFASLNIVLRLPFDFVSISNYIREKVSGLASRGRGISLIWIGSRISLPISYPRLFHDIYSGNRHPNTFSGDRTISDLSLALISRLSNAQSDIQVSLLYIKSLFKRMVYIKT